MADADIAGHQPVGDVTSLDLIEEEALHRRVEAAQRQNTLPWLSKLRQRCVPGSWRWCAARRKGRREGMGHG